MSEQRGSTSGDQYLSEFFLFVYPAVRKRLLPIIGATLLAMVVAYFLAPRPNPIFLAQTGIKLSKAAGAELMDLQNTVTFINAASFKRHLLEQMGLPTASDDRIGRLIFDSLAARAATSNIVNISARAPDEQRSRQVLNLVVKLLNDEQKKDRERLISAIEAQIAETDANISSMEKIQDTLSNLTKVAATAAASDGQMGDLRGVWALDILSRNEQALIVARASRRDLASRLEESNTYPVSIVDDVVVTPIPVVPRPSRIALLVGLFVFLVAIVLTVMLRPKEMPT